MTNEAKGRADTLMNASAPITYSISEYLEKSNSIQVQISKTFPFLYAGKNLVVGRPQTGKSFFEKLVAFKVAEERKEPILVMTEDFSAVVATQIQIIIEANILQEQAGNIYAFDPEVANKYIHIVDRETLLRNKMENFTEFLTKYGDNYCCTFADRLSLFLRGNSNSYESISSALQEIDNILAKMKYMRSLILTHHERKIDPNIKATNVNDIFESTNGSIAYLASTETHIILRRIPHKYDVNLYVESKLATEEQRIRYIVHEGKGYIKDIEKWSPLNVMTDKQKEIYKAIQHNIDNGIDTDPSTIADTLGEENVNPIRAQLSKMVAKGVVVRENGFYYPSDF